MTVEISSEVYRVLEQSVHDGHYDSMQQALDGSVLQADALNRQTFDPEHLEYLRNKIAEGLADVDAGRVVPADEVFTTLRARAAR